MATRCITKCADRRLRDAAAGPLCFLLALLPTPGSTAFGRKMPCQNPLDCPVIRFPAATYKAYNQSADLVERQSWYGSLIEEKSDDSGLMYMRNRYYNPATGSFIQEDPIGVAGGLNTYGFANGDPATYRDLVIHTGCAST